METLEKNRFKLIRMLFNNLIIIFRIQCKTEITSPEEMIYVPANTTQIGSETDLKGELPVTKKSIKGFYLDIHPVTVKEFRVFIQATNYLTDAEQFGNHKSEVRPDCLRICETQADRKFTNRMKLKLEDLQLGSSQNCFFQSA